MKPRKLIPSILLILILLFTFVALSFSQVRQQYLRDFSYLSADLRHMQQRVDDFIDDLKRGDLRAFRYITYDVLERAVLQIKDEALRHKTQLIESFESHNKEISTSARNGIPFMEYLVEYGNSSREKLVRCSLQGLFNLDPRVRLTAAHFLRKLRPDASMQRVVKMAVGIDSDWISYDRARRDFVFTPPRRLETVASRWEYYREKDLNWPTDVLPGQWGLNDHIHPGLNDNSITTDLSTARWGETLPVPGNEEYRNIDLGAGRPEVTTRGYTRMSDEDKAEYMRKVRQAQQYVGGEWKPIVREDEIPFLPEEYYRRYRTQEGTDGETVDLLSYQSAQVGDYVPMGQGVRYTYVNCDGYRVISNSWAETMKLDEFITRVIWYNKIKQKQMNCLAIISKDTFSALWRSIDGEIPQYIPFLSTATNAPMLACEDVSVIAKGLHRNKNLLNKWVMIRSLKDIYKFGDCSQNVKEDINVALWEAKREINRRSYVHGLVLTKESLRVGKLDAVAEHIREVEALEVEDRGTRTIKKEELGFRLPNTEIRANGYRLITANKTEEMANRETKLSIRQLRNNRIYAYKDENNDIIDYYRDKDRFYGLQRQYHGNSEREVINVNLLRRAQALINALLNGNGDAWRLATWPEVETAVILTLYRMMVKYEANPDDSYITTFMDQLRMQDPTVIDEENVSGDYPDDSYSDGKSDNIMRACLGGLFNRDPRIRLECVHFLRRLGPNEDMLEYVIRAKSVMAIDSPISESPETDDYRSAFIDTNIFERKEDAMMQQPLYRYQGIDEPVPGDTSSTYGPIWIPRADYTVTGYEYQKGMFSNIEHNPDGSRSFIKYYGQYQLKAPSEELNKLYKFCLRDQLVNRIKSGDVTAITRMTRAEFSVLAEVIDDEYILQVPFASFHSEPFASGRQRITVQELRGTSVITDEIWSQHTGMPDKYAIFDAMDVSVIKKGIDSTNFLVQKGTAEYLIRFYNSYPALRADKKREIQDALYFYKQDDIVVEEIVLAFEGQNPDGRAVIKVGTRLAEEMNPGGIRVYNSLPIGIRKDIRDAILDEQEEFPEALINILGVIGKRSPSVEERDRLDYQATSTGEREVVGRPPDQPEGYTSDNIGPDETP